MIRRLLTIGFFCPIALSGQTFNAARFGNPPAEVRPAMVWFWNRDISDSLIDVQLADLRRAGLAEVIIVIDRQEPGDLWRARLTHAQQEGERAGIRVRLNDGQDAPRLVGGLGSSETPEQLRAQIGLLAVRGAVGSRPIALAYDPRSPWSAALGDFVTWTARVTDLGIGRSAAHMAVVQPAGSSDSAFARVVERLEQLQAVFDVVSEEKLAVGNRGAGEIRVGTQGYHAVVVPPADSISPALAERLVALSRSGGTVVAWRPLPFTGAAWPDTGARFHVLDSLGQLRLAMIRTPWSAVREPGPTALRIRAIERGEDRVFILFNASERRLPIAPTFRMIGQPELWNPEDGTMRLAPTRWSPRFAVTDVPIELEPYQVLGIVFRARPRSPRGPIGPPPIERTVAQAKPDWQFRFTGSDTTWRPVALGPWTAIDSTYSGTGVYESTIEVPPLSNATRTGWNERYLLDLGQVRDVAEVEIDGVPLGRRLWRPYRFDVTQLIKPTGGTFRITVRVMNTSANRSGKPQPSGLLGPVRLVGVRER